MVVVVVLLARVEIEREREDLVAVSKYNDLCDDNQISCLFNEKAWHQNKINFNVQLIHYCSSDVLMTLPIAKKR